MRIQRNKSTVIAFVLMLTIAAMFITALPVAFGQAKIVMSGSITAFPSPIGLGQSVSILGLVYPILDAPYSDLVFNITKPDGTYEVIVHDSNDIGEYDFDYVCDQLGVWRVEISWPGDETHTETRPGMFGAPSASWIVQSDPVPSQEKVATNAGLATVPRTIQVGHYIYIVGFITPPRNLFGAVYPNLTFTITDPDGATDTVVKHSNSEATASFGYVCGKTGTWSVKMSFAGYVYQLPSTSETVTWTVQTEAVPSYPDTPLPTDYWEYPIPSDNYEWYQISGAWPQSNYDKAGSSWNPYTKAPDTPHVIWRLQTSEAGLIGGEYGAYATSPLGFVPIEGKTSGPIAAHGRVYYATNDIDESNTAHFVLHCRNQYTGEEIYARTLPADPQYPIPSTGFGTQATCAFEISSSVKVDPKVGVTIYGAFSIWVFGGGCTWEIAPWTGNTIFFWPGMSGSYHDGAIYFSNYNGTKGAREGGTMTKWDTRTKDTDWTAKIPGVSYYWEDILVRYEGSSSGIPFGIKITTYNATTGALIAEGPEYPYASSCTRIVGYGKLFHHSTDRKTYAFSLYTGKEVWASEEMDYPFGVWSSYGASCGAGLVFFDSHDGHLYAYDVETGDLKWRAYTEDTSETAFGAWGTWSQTIIADGKVYFACGEHTPPNPYPRGGKLRCLDIENGDELWSITGFYAKAGVQGQGGVSSGILWYPSLYDGNIWFFGKGKTATTVSVQQDVIAKGDPVLIQGTVTDQSTGAKDTPAISDEDMTEWMEYLYRGYPMPTDATGVPVMLQAMRSNGSIIDIGWATSDIMGHYEHLWTPPAEDTYKILATFCGSGSYWMSSAQTALAVTAAPEAPPEPTEEPAYTAIDLAIIAAVVVAIIIGILNLWALRKRK
jgi:outer membrane protein assembly factor BamB